MSVISPGVDFLKKYKTVMQNNSLAGSVPVKKKSPLFFQGVGGREEGGEKRRERRGENIPCNSFFHADLLFWKKTEIFVI